MSLLNNVAEKNFLISNNVIDDVAKRVNQIYEAPVSISGPLNIRDRENVHSHHHDDHKHEHRPPALSVDGGLSVEKDAIVNRGLKINSRKRPGKGKNACLSPHGRDAALQVKGGGVFGKGVLICEDEDINCDSPLHQGGLRVAGGIGCGKHIAALGGICSAGDVVISSTSSASCVGTSSATGALQVAGGISAAGSLVVCNTTSAVIDGTPVSGSILTGGGAAIGGNLIVGSTLAATCAGVGAAVINGGLSVGSNAVFCSTLPATCSGTTGALSGAVSISGGLTASSIIASDTVSFNTSCGCALMLNAVGYPASLSSGCNIVLLSGNGTLVGGVATVTFPVATVNTPISVTATDTTSTTGAGISVTGITGVGFTVHGTGVDTFSWIAVCQTACC